jgi:hypothetical protein
MLKAKGLTYHAVYQAYETLLTANPGKALLLTDDSAVFKDFDGELCEAPLKDGVVQVELAGCIDPRAWSESERCWQCDDDSAMTVAVVNSPRWVELNFFDSVEHLKPQSAQIQHLQ